MDYYSAFPFYMGYQGYGQWAQPGIVSEDRILEDLEYLQQMYPTYARKYQNTIGSVVDKMDYDGSFIYDQYPDKLTIQRMVESVVAIIRTNEETASGDQVQGAQPNVAGSDMTDRALTEQAPWREKEPWIRELVTVLTYYEILARRRKKNKVSQYFQF
ncbi:MAG: hypothetical protein HFH75_16535 [Lachnospiraceae bacterium]|jgi:hypothetical protein|nr:hypothetical protein [Lachnospiraceae bacterium]MDE6992129.1 hypothetical protein [Lachnospiraceae bacterium]MDE7002557.1 hypothetical protein [Lachnospiraceae bacterium]